MYLFLVREINKCECTHSLLLFRAVAGKRLNAVVAVRGSFAVSFVWTGMLTDFF